MTRARMCREMDSGEFAEWMAFAQLEPFGPKMDAHYFGTLIASVVNTLSGMFGKKGRAVQAHDVFKWLRDAASARKSPEEIRNKLLGIVGQMSARRQ